MFTPEHDKRIPESESDARSDCDAQQERGDEQDQATTPVKKRKRTCRFSAE